MTLAIVAEITEIHPHPNADRLEVIRIVYPINWPAATETDVAAVVRDVEELVVGKHYRRGDLGVWLRPGALIPGWLAHDLWLIGKQRVTEPFTVREIEIRGVPSPGLWCGAWYRNDSSKESKLRADDMARGGGHLVDGWISWALQTLTPHPPVELRISTEPRALDPCNTLFGGRIDSLREDR